MSSPVEALEELSALQAIIGPQDARIVSHVTLTISYQAVLCIVVK